MKPLFAALMGAFGDGPASGLNVGLSFFAPLTTSLIPARGTGNPTFVRATVASFLDFEGRVVRVLSGESRFQGARRVRNLLSTTGGSETFTTGANAIATAVITAGITDPNGGTTAFQLDMPAVNDRIFKDMAAGACTPRFSVWIRGDASGTIDLLDTGGGSGALGTLNITSAWQRFTTSVGSVIAGAAQFGIRRSNAGQLTKIYFWHPQAEDLTGQTNQNPSEYVSVGVLAAPFFGANVDGVRYFGYQNGNTVTAFVITEAQGVVIPATTLLGYLQEPATTNLNLWDEDYTQGVYTISLITQTADATAAPDGTVTADKIAEIAGTGPHGILQAYTKAASVLPYAWSIFVKAAERTMVYLTMDDGTANNGSRAWFNLSNGTVGTINNLAYTTPFGSVSARITPCINGWYRLTMIGTAPVTTTVRGHVDLTTTDGVTDYAGNLGSGAYVWGGQFEQASFETTYAGTTNAATITRNVDALSYPTAGNISDTLGSAACEFLAPTKNGIQRLLIGTTGIPLETVTGLEVLANDGTTSATTAASGSRTVVNKAASVWSGANLSAYINGGGKVTVAFDGSMNMGATMTVGDGSAAPLAGPLRNMRVWNRGVSDAEVASL